MLMLLFSLSSSLSCFPSFMGGFWCLFQNSLHLFSPPPPSLYYGCDLIDSEPFCSFFIYYNSMGYGYIGISVQFGVGFIILSCYYLLIFLRNQLKYFYFIHLLIYAKVSFVFWPLFGFFYMLGTLVFFFPFRFVLTLTGLVRRNVCVSVPFISPLSRFPLPAPPQPPFGFSFEFGGFCGRNLVVHKFP